VYLARALGYDDFASMCDEVGDDLCTESGVDDMLQDCSSFKSSVKAFKSLPAKVKRHFFDDDFQQSEDDDYQEYSRDYYQRSLGNALCAIKNKIALMWSVAIGEEVKAAPKTKALPDNVIVFKNPGRSASRCVIYKGNVEDTPGCWLPNNFDKTAMSVRGFIFSFPYGLRKHPQDRQAFQRPQLLRLMANLEAMTSCDEYTVIFFHRIQDNAMVREVMETNPMLIGQVEDLVSHWN
jgi:hypothetical protein